MPLASNDNARPGKREPILVTISFSHYCEKARWGLDLAGARYREEGHLPLFHFAAVALATRGARDKAADSTSTRFSTPVLITREGERICDSTRILQHLCAAEGLSLYDPPEALALDEKYSKSLGPHTRRFGYHHLLRDKHTLRKFFWSLDNKVQAAGALLWQPVYARVLRKALRINADSAERSRQKILAVAGSVEERLADGRRYLCGDTFSAADLSFAALLAPCLLVTREEGYRAAFPSIEQTGGPLAAFASDMRARGAGQFALRIYCEHRGRSADVKLDF